MKGNDKHTSSYANGLKQSFTAPDGTTYEYVYGANNELREVRIPGLGSITISEYQWNRPKTMRYPGGSTREYEYDPLMRLTRLVATDPGGNSLLDYAYEYDITGNIVSKTTEHGTYSYGYDGASRLTSVDNPGLDDESYSYDAVGNRTAASNAASNISHNANNELLVYGDVEYVYDANGNMMEVRLDGQMMFTYHYNADNRLVKVEGGNNNTIAEYYYDPFGRRLWKEVSGGRTYFFYSDEGLIGEYNASGTELRNYGYKTDSTWTTDPLFLKEDSKYYFYQNDHLGTPQKLVAQNGSVVWSAQYSAFGEARIEIEMMTNNLRFPGQYYDQETGLHYNFQRYYDPGIGRYMSVDPIGFEAGDVNLYGYVKNNPMVAFDMHGTTIFSMEIRGTNDSESWIEKLPYPYGRGTWERRTFQDLFYYGHVAAGNKLGFHMGKDSEAIALFFRRSLAVALLKFEAKAVWCNETNTNPIWKQYAQNVQLIITDRKTGKVTLQYLQNENDTGKIAFYEEPIPEFRDGPAKQAASTIQEEYMNPDGTFNTYAWDAPRLADKFHKDNRYRYELRGEWRLQVSDVDDVWEVRFHLGFSYDSNADMSTATHYFEVVSPPQKINK